MKTLEANYIKDFKCDATACGAYCCKNQNISVDDKMISKYKHIQPPIKSKEITSNIKKNFIMLKFGVCPFFEKDDHTCAMMDNYGEEYMPLICRTYPHYHNYFGDKMVVSLFLTCPVARNMILKRSEPIEIVEDTVKWRTTKLVNLYKNPKAAFLEIYQEYGVKILQDKAFSLDERLALTGNYLMGAKDIEEWDGLNEYSENFANNLENEAKNLPEFDKKEFMARMIFILTRLYGPEGIAKETRSIGLTQLVDGVFEMAREGDKEKEINMEEIFRLYDERYVGAKKEFEKKFDKELTNLAVHLYLFNLTPILPDDVDYKSSISYFKLLCEYMAFIMTCGYYNLEDEMDFNAFSNATEGLAEMFENEMGVIKFFRALSTGV